MDRPLTRFVVRPETILLFVLAAAVFHPSSALAQSFCGPLIPVNFSGPLGGNGTNGQYPSGYLVIDGKGNVYGTTAGTIWKYSPTGGFTTLFAPSTGPGFNGVILDSQGNLWGTTSGGGTDNDGTIFEFTTAAVFNTVFDFDGTNGQGPGPLVFDSQGNLWGVTGAGGADGDGTLFEFSPATQQLTHSVSFPGGGLSAPLGPVAFDSQGNLYGVTYSGGTDGFGSLWEYSAQGVLTTLVNFTGLNGEYPSGGVTLDGKGNIYGTTFYGGAGAIPPASGYGSVSLQTGELTTLYSFTESGTTGQVPTGGVTLDTNGNLYGTTTYGGTDGDGVVWEYSSAGVLTDLVTFSGPNGENPESTLVFDNLGNLWGTTNQGGAFGYGTVFELTPNTAGCGPTLSSLAFNPTTIPNGGTSTGTVTLSGAAPSGGSVVGLSSNSSFIIVPGSVTVPAGATSTTFAITTNGFVLSNTAVTITATLENSTVQATLTETPGVAVKSISLKPSSVTAGNSTTATVTLTAAAPSGGNQVLVEFCANCNPADPDPPVRAPVTVTVPAGQTSVSFSLGTLCTSTKEVVPMFAESGGASVSSNLTVNPGSSCVPTVSALELSLSSVTGGNTLTGTVILNSTASSGTVVSLSSNSGSAGVPSSVTVPSGSFSADFTVTTTSVTTTTTAVITATLGSSSAQASLTITPGSSVSLSSLSVGPTVTGGMTSSGAVILTAGAPSGGAVVSLSSSNTSVATVPSSVTVAAGQNSAGFTVSTQTVSQNTNVTISGMYGGATESATLTVTPPNVNGLTLNPTSVTAGSSSTGTVTLFGNAPSGGAVVSLTSSNSSVATVPSSVTVAAGSSSATFTVSTTSVSTSTNVTISGTYGGANASATLSVTPAAAVTLSSLTLNPTSVSGGSSSTGTVTLSGNAPSGGAVVTLTSGNTSVATVPSSVTVAAGNTSVTFTVSTQRASQNTNVTISGTYAGATQSATLTVTSGRHH